MPVSRPILIALGAALLALVAFVATSGMRSGGDSSAPAPKPVQAAAPNAAKPEPAKSAPAPSKPADAKDASPAQSNSAKVSDPKPASSRSGSGAPARVQRAVESGRTAVLFFYQRGGADDSATADAVAALRGRRGVSVFRAPVGRLGDFRAVTGRIGISQAPAVVIVGKKGKSGRARVVEGFVDPKTLAQEVADAR
jgi:hypothetical protein